MRELGAPWQWLLDALKIQTSRAMAAAYRGDMVAMAAGRLEDPDGCRSIGCTRLSSWQWLLDALKIQTSPATPVLRSRLGVAMAAGRLEDPDLNVDAPKSSTALAWQLLLDALKIQTYRYPDIRLHPSCGGNGSWTP